MDIEQENCVADPSGSEVSTIANALTSRLETGGFRARMVSMKRLGEAATEVAGRLASGSINRQLYNEYLAFLDSAPSPEASQAKSVIVVAAPQPHVRLTARWHEQVFELIVPPTYEHRVDREISALIASTLAPHGFRLWPANVPKKLVAVRSGLARYGKNNLAYVEGMGSYFRLVTFFSSLPASDGPWHEARVLELCEKCTACIKHCPTEAITADRFLIRADRCLTYHNEHENPFPAWIDPSWHHCLVGCLKCQQTCPINVKVAATYKDSVRLDHDDVDALLSSGAPERLAPCKAAALAECGLSGRAWLARNLRAVLESQTGADDA